MIFVQNDQQGDQSLLTLADTDFSQIAESNSICSFSEKIPSFLDV